jgi:hypothetical protein
VDGFFSLLLPSTFFYLKKRKRTSLAMELSAAGIIESRAFYLFKTGLTVTD